MARFFTLEEAERLIPEVERAMRDALRLRAENASAEGQLEKTARDIFYTGGMQVDRGRLLTIKQRQDQTALELKAKLEEIELIGCLVKDLDIGLIDFPTIYRGQEVYLCWKFGETGIGFWHGVTEGFRGRKPIDEEFRRSHRNEAL
jgi:hypothetical protein